MTIDHLPNERHYEYAILHPLHATSKIKTVPCDPRTMATADSEPCTTEHSDPGHQCRHFQHTSDAPIKSSFGPVGAIVEEVFSAILSTTYGREVGGGAGGRGRRLKKNCCEYDMVLGCWRRWRAGEEIEKNCCEYDMVLELLASKGK